MTISVSGSVNGVLRKAWHDDLEQYQEFAPDGVTVTLTRAYTVVELAEKAERVARQTAQNNATSLRTQTEAAIAALITDVSDFNSLAGTANATINANPATYIKLLGAGLRRTDKAVIGLSRIIAGAVTTTDTGV